MGSQLSNCAAPVICMWIVSSTCSLVNYLFCILLRAHLLQSPAELCSAAQSLQTFAALAVSIEKVYSLCRPATDLQQPTAASCSLLLLGDTGFPPDLRPLYMFCPIDIDSGSPNPVQTHPLLNKPIATQRPCGLIIVLFYFSYDFLIISPLYYLLFLLSPYLGL